MPKIINAYAPDESIATALSGLASSFMGNTPQVELYRQKAREAQRQNESTTALADAIVGSDPAAMARLGILSGVTPQVAGGYRQFLQTNRFGPNSQEALAATMAVPGANFGNTMQGTEAEMANRRTIADMTTARTRESEKYKTDNTPVNVIGADGKPAIGRLSESFGQQPVLPLTQAQGAIAQNGSWTPEQQANMAGANKNPSQLYVGRTASGKLAPTMDGRANVQDPNDPIVGPVQKLEGPNTDALSGSNSAQNDMLRSRVATEQTVALIDRIVTNMSQPNSAAAIGWLGQGATFFNNVRAQFEATSSLLGAPTADQEFAAPALQQAVGQAINVLTANPTWVAKAQQLGIDSGTLRSQIQDLAFAVAKSQDPSGRVSTDDVKRAAETIGASLMDPKAAVAVLGDLKARIVDNQAIRERVTSQMYPQMPGGQPGQPQAQQPAPAAPQQAAPAVKRFERGPDGSLQRVQ